MNIRVIYAILLIAVMLFSCGCSDNSNLEAMYVLRHETEQTPSEVVSFKVDNTTPYEELISKTVDIHMFAQKYSFLVKPWTFYMNQIDADFGLECVRETAKGALYSVHKVEQGGLLYIFYCNEIWRDNQEEGPYPRPVRRWFYVREDLSYADFERAIEEKGTMDDIIRVDETGQIFYNLYSADWIDEEPPTECYTWHYLSDGVLELSYRREGNTFVLVNHNWRPDFDLDYGAEAVDIPYNAQILEIDRVK